MKTPPCSARDGSHRAKVMVHYVVLGEKSILPPGPLGSQLLASVSEVAL